MGFRVQGFAACRQSSLLPHGGQRGFHLKSTRLKKVDFQALSGGNLDPLHLDFGGIERAVVHRVAQGYLADTNRTPLGPCSRPMPRVLWWF